MTNETTKFLQECKKVGYKHVTIFIADKKVPDSVRIRKINTGHGINEKGLNKDGRFVPKKGFLGCYWGHGTPGSPFKVVCAAPEVKGPHPHLPNKPDGSPRWPAIWGIVKQLGLNHRGGGHLEGHDIGMTSLLDAGYYDLSQIN